MGKNRDGQLLEIIRKAIIAAVEKGAGLRGALKHESAARTDAESQLFGFARAEGLQG